METIFHGISVDDVETCKSLIYHDKMEFHPLTLPCLLSVKIIKQQLERFPIEAHPTHSIETEEKFLSVFWCLQSD